MSNPDLRPWAACWVCTQKLASVRPEFTLALCLQLIQTCWQRAEEEGITDSLHITMRMVQLTKHLEGCDERAVRAIKSHFG